MDAQVVQALAKQAEKAYQAGRFSQAADLYQRAGRQYEVAGDLTMAAEMDNNASVSFLQGGNAQAALDAAQGTEQIFAEKGDLRSQALAIGNQAAALDALNRLDEALERYRLCSDLLKQSGNEDYRSHVLKSISAIQIRTGHQLEALASMDAALQNQKKLSLKERLLKKLLNVPFQMLKRG